MTHKSHLISGGIGLALGALLTAMLIPSSMQPSAPAPTPQTQPKPTSSTPAVKPTPAADAPVVPPPAEATPPPPKMAPLFKALYTLRATAESSNAIKIFFSSDAEINLKHGENLFITPAVDEVRISHSWWDNEGMRLSGDFKPETTYTITLKAGLTSQKNEQLLQDATLTVTTPPPKPELDIMSYRGQLPLTPQASLAYTFTACEEINVEVWRAFENNLITYGQTPFRDSLLEPYAKKTLKVRLDKQEKQHALLPLAELVNNKPGVYRFKLSAGSDCSDKCYDECYVILSNIGASYVYDHRLLPIVALQNLVDGTPIANADVALYDDKHQCIAKGRSDAQGFAVTQPVASSFPRTSQIIPERMIIKAGDDVTIIGCNRSDARHNAYLPNAKGVSTFPTYIWPDRDAIHPGENVQIYGLIRTAALAAAKDKPVTLELTAPDETLLTNATVTSNQDGYITTSFTLPKGAATGYYTVRAKLGEEILNTCDLYVSDFVPNHVKLNATFIDDNIDALSLSTLTYFGSAVTKGSGYYQINAAPAPLPTAWKGWTVGTNEGSRQLHSDTFKKDSKERTIVLEGVDPDVLKTFNAPVRVRASITFNEPNARSVKTSTFIDKTPHPAYLGMRYDEASQTLEFRQLTTDGNPPASATVGTFLLTEHITTYELVKGNSDWRYQWVESERNIPVEEFLPPTFTQPVQLSDEIVRLPLTHLKPGQYTLSAMLGDLTTSVTFWHDTSELGKRLGAPSNLVFKTDKPSYTPGETAQLSFIAPVEGRLILTTGDTRLEKSLAFEVKQGLVTLPITIPATTTHGVWHAGVTLIAKDINKEGRFFGLAPINVDHTSKALQLTLDLPDITRPTETIQAKLTLTDKQGHPCRGTVALFAVDEAVLDVTECKTPDPHMALFQRQDQTFTFGDIYSTLLPQLTLGPDGQIGGDGASTTPTPHESSDVSATTTVLTFPLQTIDASGVLTLPVELPTFAGSLRFMAVVANDHHVGATDATVIVRDPVTMTASTARYACADDRVECTLRVINHDLPKQPYTLTVADQTFTGELATGDTTFHTLTLPAGAVTATFTMGEYTTTLTHTMALQTEVPTHDVVTIHRGETGAPLPEGAEPLPSLAAAQNIALDWLANYPYCCTEQLSARMLPYASSTKDNERAFVKRLFNTLMPRFLPNGYFSLWDNSTIIHTMASLSASHVLIEATQTGLMPVDNLPKILTFLNLLATNTDAKLRGEAAYAAFLLGEAGAKQQALHAARNLLIANENDPAAYIAAATLVFNGAADEGAPKMKAYLAKNPRPQPLVEPYMDDAAAQAMTLAFARRAGVCTDAEAETRLATLLTTPWTTTQANAWAARALAACEDLSTGPLYRTRKSSTTLPENAPIRVTKSFINTDGEPITTLSHADLAFVVLKVELPTDCDNLVIRDRLPGGLEYEDANLATRESIQIPEAYKDRPRFTAQAEENLGAELRFFGGATKGTFYVLYPVRATTKGTFAIPAAIVEDMYDVTCIGGDDPTGTFTIQ